MHTPYADPWKHGYCDALFNRPACCPWKGWRYLRRAVLYQQGYFAGTLARRK